MTRYLRIAGAVAFALLACAMIGLWIRSYSLHDQLTYEGDRSIWFGASTRGGVTIGRQLVQMPPDDGDRFHLLTLDYDQLNFTGRMLTTFGFGYMTLMSGASVTLPHWFLAASSFALAALFAVKKFSRFTTRDVLFATTVAALLLGLGVCLLQRL
jgi:hypothetical protein